MGRAEQGPGAVSWPSRRTYMDDGDLCEAHAGGQTRQLGVSSQPARGSGHLSAGAVGLSAHLGYDRVAARGGPRRSAVRETRRGQGG